MDTFSFRRIRESKIKVALDKIVKKMFLKSTKTQKILILLLINLQILNKLQKSLAALIVSSTDDKLQSQNCNKSNNKLYFSGSSYTNSLKFTQNLENK